MGSSAKRKSKGCTRARSVATRCCCPKDIFPTLVFILSAIPSCSKQADVRFVELHHTFVILPIAQDVTAKGAFSEAALSLNKVELAFFEPKIGLLPHIRFQVFALQEHVRRNLFKANTVHHSNI